MNDKTWEAAKDLVKFVKAHADSQEILDAAVRVEHYLNGDDEADQHIKKTCERDGCSNEATRWYEDPKAAWERPLYVCTDHEDVQKAEETGWITNSEGKEVELAVYSCSDDCAVCNE